MSTPRPLLKSQHNDQDRYYTCSMKTPMHLGLDEDGFRKFMSEVTEELIERTNRLKKDGYVDDFSYIKEIYLGKVWDNYFETQKF